MSRQINFFTHPLDAPGLHAFLLKTLPGVRVLPQEGGPAHEMVLRPPDLDAPDRVACLLLVPLWAWDRLVMWDLPGGRLRVDQRASPVLEYKPRRYDPAANVVTSGRLYWSYEGAVEKEQERQLNRLFQWVRAHSIPTPFDRRWRILEHGSRNGCLLDYGFGLPYQPSPPWRAE